MLLTARLDPADVEKVGNDFVLRGHTGVQVTSRAHKMSKSRGNVINPDDVINAYGADSLRLYEMFMGPLRETKVLSVHICKSTKIVLLAIPSVSRQFSSDQQGRHKPVRGCRTSVC